MLPEEEKETTKVIEYRNQFYRVPVWVQYVVTDNKGQIWGSSLPPLVLNCDWWSFKGEYVLLPSVEINWKDSLRHYE